MDGVLGVNRGCSNASMKTQKQAANGNKTRSSRKSSKENIKVVYISNPMKVKTSASEFRALVQELTGQHSDTARLMEMTNYSSTSTTSDNSKGTIFGGSDADEDVHYHHPHHQQQQNSMKGTFGNDDFINDYVNFNSTAFYDIEPPIYFNTTTTTSTTSQPLFHDDQQHFDHHLDDDGDDVFVTSRFIDSSVL